MIFGGALRSFQAATGCYTIPAPIGVQTWVLHNASPDRCANMQCQPQMQPEGAWKELREAGDRRASAGAERPWKSTWCCKRTRPLPDPSCAPGSRTLHLHRWFPSLLGATCRAQPVPGPSGLEGKAIAIDPFYSPSKRSIPPIPSHSFSLAALPHPPTPWGRRPNQREDGGLSPSAL